MANVVTIDVEARFVDHVTKGMSSATKSAEKYNKELDKMNKKTVKPKLGADDNAFTKKIREAQSKAEKLGKTKVAATLGLVDKASAKIGSVTGAARAFAGKNFRSSLTMSDKASSVIGDVTGAARSFAGKTFTAAVKIIDYATTPLRKIKESLFSIKSLIGTIAAGFAAKQLFVNPVLNYADTYSQAQIGFSTLLGKDKGQAMMNEIDSFAKATPFKTSNVISNVQKMMAYGWDADKVIDDMKTIGDAAAATGKGDEGLGSIVYALSEIRSKGKLSTQELNQLASAGIKAKQYLAEGLGYGTDDAGLMKLAEDLEDGAIGANQAVELILQGMKEFDGMMDKTANETAKGLWDQITDTFEISILRKWGQGLQDGAIKGLGSVLNLLNSNEDAIEDFGDTVHDIGKELSTWAAEKLENTLKTINEIVNTDAFKNASLGGKIKLLFEGTVMDPLKQWWNSEEVQSWIEEKKEWLAEKAEGWGESLGKGLSNGLLTLLGVDISDEVDYGKDVGASFAKGFAEGFDGDAVASAIADAVGRTWDMLPAWAKVLIGGYASGKVIAGVGNVAGGLMNIGSFASSLWGSAGGMAVDGTVIAGSGIRGLIGTTGNATMSGTGIASGLASTGYALTGGAAGSALSGGAAAAIGGLSIAGAVAGVASVGKGVSDLYKAYKAHQAGDSTEAEARVVSGSNALAGAGAGALAGAAIGSAIPIVGTAVGALVGAGVGGVAGWIKGNYDADKIRAEAAEIEAAKYASKEMQEAVKNTELSAEELQTIFADACWKDMENRFGDMELSMAEIESLAKGIVFNKDATGMQKFADAAAKAEQSLSNYQNAAADIERLNFDMSEHLWKVNMGIGEKLSDEEIANVKARVQNYITSAEQVLSDQHYQFNAAVDVIMQPTGKEDENSIYSNMINNANSLYAQMQKELDEQTLLLEGRYDVYLKDGVITADEQATLSKIQEKIAEITEKVANAETEATFTVAKMKFTTGELSPESFVEFQSSLETQLESYISQQDQALQVSITGLNLQLAEGTITDGQYNQQLQTLVSNYNNNIETMTARVNSVQLEGISEAFDGVATVEQLQGAIDGVLASGEDPLDLTFSDINAHLNLGEDVLKEEEKANFVAMMQSAIQNAASGENALTTTLDVAPTVQMTEETKAGITTTIEEELSYVENQFDFNTTGNVKMDMYGRDHISLSEEANLGRSSCQSAFDTAFSDPFSINAKANVNLDWSINNPSATVNFSGAGTGSSSVTASIAAENANGNIINSKTLSWVGEEGPEAIIPLVPGRRSRGLKLWEEAGRRLGVQYHAEGGFVGGDSSFIPPFSRRITPSGEQTIEINMGGVTIEIKADGNKSMVDNIEEQEQEIAEKVAEIFKNVFSAQFANMPLRQEA